MRIPKWPISGEREQELLASILASRQWGGFHEIVGQFEQQFAAFQHCAHGISVANGTLALEVALEAAGVGRGDEVIVPAISFVSTATAVSRVGAVPVFVDIEPYTFNIDPDCAARAVTPKTKALIPVHFGGPLADMDRLVELARAHNLFLLEDAAHAHGSEWKGRRAGSFGHASTFSFQNGKVLTAGEGGIVLTNDQDFAAKVRSLANQGRRPGATFFHHFDLGTNLRLTAFQAAVLIAGIERLPDQTATRTRNARLLLDELAGVVGIHWQQVDPRINTHSWYLMLGRVDASRLGVPRDEFHKMLTAAGVPCTPFYPHTLYQNPLYERMPCRVEPCPNAEASIRDAFWMPHYLLLGDEELMREVAGVIRAAVSQDVRVG
jgi:dTDP-4-amino-4,6-dideoxygalactose transaminase